MAATLPCMTLISPLRRKSSGRLLVSPSAHFPLISSSPLKSIRPLVHKGKTQQGFCLKRALPLPRCSNLPTDLEHPEPAFEPTDAKDTVIEFYSFIKDKNLDKLQGLLSENCYFEDLSFPKPFQGRKEVMHFLRELAAGMGKHTSFKIEKVIEGDDRSTAGLMWHLEWKDKRIPFTRGCTFFECSNDKGKLVIEKALVVSESPLKPGAFVLKVLSVVSSVFDRFPNLTEKFLLRPHILLKIIARIYKLFIEPMILPVFVYYMHLWTFATSLISYIGKIVVMILKLFR